MHPGQVPLAMATSIKIAPSISGQILSPKQAIGYVYVCHGGPVNLSGRCVGSSLWLGYLTIRLDRLTQGSSEPTSLMRGRSVKTVYGHHKGNMMGHLPNTKV